MEDGRRGRVEQLKYRGVGGKGAEEYREESDSVNALMRESVDARTLDLRGSDLQFCKSSKISCGVGL